MVSQSGTIEWQRRATLRGELSAPSSGGVTCPLWFPGQYHDDETDLDYNLQHYDGPATARYTSPDPLGLEGETPGPAPIPKVDNAKLQNIIDGLYHGVGNPNQIGDGSAMAAAEPMASNARSAMRSRGVTKATRTTRS